MRAKRKNETNANSIECGGSTNETEDMSHWKSLETLTVMGSIRKCSRSNCAPKRCHHVACCMLWWTTETQHGFMKA